MQNANIGLVDITLTCHFEVKDAEVFGGAGSVGYTSGCAEAREKPPTSLWASSTIRFSVRGSFTPSARALLTCSAFPSSASGPLHTTSMRLRPGTMKRRTTMKIIKPGFEFITPINGSVILKRLEECGRVCYKSEGKITDDSAPKFVAGIIKRGHEAVLEHCSFTVKFVCDRGVSHEIVRHRLASYCQESTRYCNYGKDQFGSEITVIEPCYLNENTFAYDEWKEACRRAETAYFNLLNWGLSPQEARAVLPNSLKTEVVMTANIREWRHFLRLRTSTGAHPQIREVATPLLRELQQIVPVCFDDILPKEADHETS